MAGVIVAAPLPAAWADPTTQLLGAMTALEVTGALALVLALVVLALGGRAGD